MISELRLFGLCSLIVAALGAHADPGYDIIVVGGQSNSSNSGLGERFDPLQGIRNDRIYHLSCLDKNRNNILDGNDASGVVPLTEYTQDCQSNNADNHSTTLTYKKVGFAVSFARQYAVSRLPSDRKVLIVAGGIGGTGQSQWAPGSPYLENLLSRVRASLILPGKNRVVAFLWSQGESDISSVHLALEDGSLTQAGADRFVTEYAFRLQSIIVYSRDSLGNPNLPFLIGPKPTQWTAYQSTKLRYLEADRFAARTAGRSGVVSDYGLTSNRLCQPGEIWGTVCDPAFIHFSAQAQVNIGIRFFNLYDSIAPKP